MTIQQLRVYWLWLLLLPVVVYVTAIPLVRSRSFERWNPSHWGPILDFDFRTEGQNADVVIFGDSSAFLGVDPRIMGQLGIKSVVLPNTAGSLPVMADQALEYYLAHNTPPRLIVLYFTPWDLDYKRTDLNHLYEGEELLLRHGTPQQILHFSEQHPLEILAFPMRLYSSVGPHILSSFFSGEDRAAQALQGHGHVADTEEYPPLSNTCTLPAADVRSLTTASVEALQQKYLSRHYNVVVHLAPIPACTGADLLTHNSYGRTLAAPPRVLPPSDFKDDGLYAHVQPGSVEAVTRLLAEEIRSQSTGLGH